MPVPAVMIFGMPTVSSGSAITTPGRNFGWKMIFFTCVAELVMTLARPDFRAGTGGRRHGDDRSNALDIGTGPPVANVLEVPYRARLPRHEGDALAEVEARTAAERDDAVVTAILERLDAGIEVLLVRVRIHVGEDGTAEAGVFQNIQRRLGDRHRGEAPIGDQKRLLDPQAFAGIRQLRDPAPAELDGGGIAPIG